MEITKVSDPVFSEKLADYYARGGVIEFDIFHITAASGDYQAHLETAKQTIGNVTSTFDVANLENSGHPIDLKAFMGAYYDLALNKPLIRGQLNNDTLNAYFYYDQEETPANAVRITGEVPHGFVYAFTEPPYTMRMDRDIKKFGEYFLDFTGYLFDDLHNLTIYTWSTGCSPVFDAGDEWWGSFFWTVYNPAKQWYIGIIASTTD